MLTRILILMSETGGGHRSAAEAIAEAVEHLQPGQAQVELLDFIAACAPFPLNRVARLYRPAVNYAAPLWGWLWYASDDPRRMALSLKALVPLAKGKLMAFLHQRKPKVIVSVHPLANHLAVRAVRELGQPIPVITVVTDLVSAHSSWFCPDVDLCIVPSQEARERALRAGLPSEKIEVVGLPVGRRFREMRGEKGDLREALGLRRDLSTVLLVGGGEGMGRVYDMARAVAGAGLPLQLVVVAGRNEGLRHRLEATRWEVPTRVYGFVTHMPELMAAADLIVTKAGPGTISEALVMGLPILISDFVPGQEEGNVRYVVEGGAGLLADTPQKLAAALGELLAAGSEALARMAANARRLARPEAALEIARLILADRDLVQAIKEERSASEEERGGHGRRYAKNSISHRKGPRPRQGRSTVSRTGGERVT
ncbi:MAG: glycosyltransferase [Anaerolineae bacterium]